MPYVPGAPDAATSISGDIVGPFQTRGRQRSYGAVYTVHALKPRRRDEIAAPFMRLLAKLLAAATGGLLQLIRSVPPGHGVGWKLFQSLAGKMEHTKVCQQLTVLAK